MQRLTENKVILVVRNTRLDDLVVRFNSVSQAQFYVEHLGADFGDYRAEHTRYHQAVRQTENHLQRLGRVQVVHRSFLPTFVFGEHDTVVVVGQDGLVANTVKYLDGQPVIGVNPDPERWDGKLLPFKVDDLPVIVPETWNHRRPRKTVTMAQATLNNGQRLYAVNDLFIGPKSHTSVRYSIQTVSQQETQSSSGIIVSTGLGSTGWLASILTGAQGIASAASGSTNPEPPKHPSHKPIAWDAPRLVFSVREPFPSRTTAASLLFGDITPDQPLTLISQTAENAVIFSDGIEADYIEFNSGTRATISIADKHGTLVV
jgi:NAD kinase